MVIRHKRKLRSSRFTKKRGQTIVVGKIEYRKKIGPWKIETDLPVFDDSLKHPDNPFRSYNMKLVWKTPQQALMYQFKQSRIYREDGLKGLNEWEKTTESMKGPIEKLSMFKEMQKNNGKIPIIVEEYNADGSVFNFQEGRTRSQIARALGIKKIPILQATKRERIGD